MATPVLRLNSGHDMPQVGMGLWKLENSLAAETVYQAIKAGYRLFDGACDYGNEVECGQGVARAIAEGLVKREDLFIVSKLWNTFHDPDRVEPVVRRQLADWAIDYFDLYLVHFPVALAWVDPAVRYPPGWHFDGKAEIRRSHATLQQTWEAMEGLVGAGLARSIGVSNYQAQSLYDLVRYAKVQPAALQIEHHPYLTQPELLQLAKEEGIVVTAYSSFGPASFVEFNMKDAVDLVPLLEDDRIKAIADSHDRPVAQVLLRWATQRGLAVIPKASSPERLLQNLKHTDFDLTADDVEKISSLDRGLRFNKPTNYFTTDKLWIFG